MSLLTDEEITPRVVGIVDSDLTPAEFANYRNIGEYVEAKTLKAVAEWVLDNYEAGESCQCIMFVNNLVNALRSGKMPGEEK